ncbi:hypothetical protein [Lentimicrobium sp. S6]|uniref:hypothetical protein n=1 Tax=Lentimicrobium sp. S6 TaxID=2735872 RepID=UPI001556D65C|nr:hypothetical protein [Lentimicrobium sp. S6]NPD48078.1 hypothetical protein [Lentimicrobium sp. S6]
MKNDSNKFNYVTAQDVIALHGAKRISYSTARRNIRKVLKKLNITSRSDCTFEEYCNHYDLVIDEVLECMK